jgi:integrase
VIFVGKISTKELLDGYFKSVEDTTVYSQKLRPILDKPALYEYEIEIGKELIDMDVDDLFGLIKKLTQSRNGKRVSFMTSHLSYDQIAVLLRGIFNYYIDTVEPIKNPLYDKRMRGAAAAKRLAEDTVPFTWDVVEDVIKKMHVDYPAERADYIEMLMLMYYCGFRDAEEVVSLKENMIDHRARTVDLPGRTVQLSNRLHKLLVKFQDITEISDWRTYSVVSYRGSYFKFIIRPNQVDSFDERPESNVRDMLNRVLANYVNNKYDTKINYSSLYWCGFYNYLVKLYGEKDTNYIINAVRDSEAVSKLMSAAKDYGVKCGDNVSHLKRYLRPFIKND